MDISLTSGQVARRLQTTRPRINRAVRSQALTPRKTSGGHLRFSTRELEQLTQQLGLVPRVDGYSREEILVLAALWRRPLGLASARAVARAAGISPTAASKALNELSAGGLVRRTNQKVAAGRVRQIKVWAPNVRRGQFRRLGPVLGKVVFPVSGSSRPLPDRVPSYLAHLFWNVDPNKLRLPRDAEYVAVRILTSEDAQVHAWAAQSLPQSAFKDIARLRGLPAERVALANNLARRSG